MRWSEFQKSAPDLARLAEERFARSGSGDPWHDP